MYLFKKEERLGSKAAFMVMQSSHIMDRVLTVNDSFSLRFVTS
jgi:hypothetical protein